MSLKDYIIRDIQEKFKYLPSAVYLALICIAMYIFVCLLRYLFTMREVSQADERRKKIVGKIWHMLFCGTFVAYMYTLIMIVYYSREPGSNYVDVNFKIDERTNRVIAMGALDNLVKGAAGQAVQNMNIMFGFDEAEGLRMAPVFP